MTRLALLSQLSVVSVSAGEGSTQIPPLLGIVAQEAPLSSQLHARLLTHMVFSKSWAPCGSRFKEFGQLAAGLATVMPTTSRVEGDFSLMCYRRNIYSSALTDFALEGAVYAKQYDDLQVAASKL